MLRLSLIYSSQPRYFKLHSFNTNDVQEDLPQDREVVDYGEQVSEPSEAIYDQETEQTNLVSSILSNT